MITTNELITEYLNNESIIPSTDFQLDLIVNKQEAILNELKRRGKEKDLEYYWLKKHLSEVYSNNNELEEQIRVIMEIK